ncbi:MAG: hypothetical protein PUC29_04975 [Clostridia bacterium]|nr:hypothetical protein [Clostridia bacterium]
MNALRKRIILIALLTLIFVAALILTVTLIGNKKAIPNNEWSAEKLSRYIDYDLTDIEICDVLTERLDGGSEANGTEYDSTVVCIKLNATDEQLNEIMSTITREDLSISPGDLRFFEKNGISTESIEKMGCTWSQYEDKKLFSTTYKPYTMDWFFLEKGCEENYNVIIITSLPV